MAMAMAATTATGPQQGRQQRGQYPGQYRQGSKGRHELRLKKRRTRTKWPLDEQSLKKKERQTEREEEAGSRESG